MQPEERAHDTRDSNVNKQGARSPEGMILRSS
jgi:hypothetical protein